MSSCCCFFGGTRSFARLLCVIVWSSLISVVLRIPESRSIRSRTEYRSLALFSWDSDGFLIIGIPSSSAHFLHMLTMSDSWIPVNRGVSSEVFLHIVHLAINRDIGAIFKECCGGVYIILV